MSKINEVEQTIRDLRDAASLLNDTANWLYELFSADKVQEHNTDSAETQKQLTLTYDGFKVVEGRSNRKYTDENAVVEAVKSAGFDPYEHSVLGITAMTALLGKKRFSELLGELIEKPQGKPTLVSISDKRPAIYTANEDFKEDK